MPIHAPEAPAASTAARPRAEEIPPAARTGRETASRTAFEEGKGADLGFAVSASFGPSGYQHVDPGVGGPPGLR